MSKVVQFEETVIPAMYVKAVTSSPVYQMPEECASDLFKAIIRGLADGVKQVRSRENPVAVVIKDDSDKIIFGVKIEFIPGDKEDAGSWNTVWSFNEEDFTDDNIKIYQAEDPKLEPWVLNHAAVLKLEIKPGAATLHLLEKNFAQVMISYLDQNAIDGDQFVVEMDGYFEATVDVVDGIKVLNFIPDEEITNLAKGDAAIYALPKDK